MSRNPYQRILEEEVAVWPGVIWEFEDSRRHDRVRFYYGMQARVLHMSRGSKKLDAGRGLKNWRAEIRRLLREMGAKEAA